MRFKRGDVVLVRFPNSDLVTYKKRPALIIQDENVETGLSQQLAAQITSNLARRKGETRVFVSNTSAEGQEMGLVTDSVIMADGIATVIPREIEKAIGRCPVMLQVDQALRKILGL